MLDITRSVAATIMLLAATMLFLMVYALHQATRSQPVRTPWIPPALMLACVLGAVSLVLRALGI